MRWCWEGVARGECVGVGVGVGAGPGPGPGVAASGTCLCFASRPNTGRGRREREALGALGLGHWGHWDGRIGDGHAGKRCGDRDTGSTGRMHRWHW